MSILIVSRSSVNHLNKIIRANSKPTSGVSKAISADLFTSNIVVAKRACQSSIRIRQDQLLLDTIDPCQRCQMLYVDQPTGVRRNEIFAALPKMRKVDGRVQFGRYAVMSTKEGENIRKGPGSRTIIVGDVVLPTEQNH
ncbi:uncharacterized protein N7446_005629 [Penicillium canescens]|uniref:MOSC domain-containing protein n=1 Tax=Penicillium canescens TaxID=5083 RepID=A0AAD6NBG3_PENCN|nr:uncharacterized protein N7446_005629 [Penicillium canescens]KAJ6050127.1 hypothetical protein N7444_006843 [Penicillium canescens]KAJ6051000.1 hypothetical protein N7460_001534 [Penicillium canescens]KAJ6061509.1 hypothetical protein N7446_005629 [Penicillium canescens]